MWIFIQKFLYCLVYFVSTNLFDKFNGRIENNRRNNNLWINLYLKSQAEEADHSKRKFNGVYQILNFVVLLIIESRGEIQL